MLGGGFRESQGNAGGRGDAATAAAMPSQALKRTSSRHACSPEPVFVLMGANGKLYSDFGRNERDEKSKATGMIESSLDGRTRHPPATRGRAGGAAFHHTGRRAAQTPAVRGLGLRQD